ncbi:MAG: ATP-binding protein [Alphaproteobacteria bacterium]
MIDAMFGHMPLPLFVKDRDGRFILVNKAAMDLVDAGGILRPGDSFIGKTDFDIYPGEIAQTNRTGDLIAMSGQSYQREEFVPITNDPHLGRWMMVSKFPLYDDKGAIDGVMVFAQDITESQRSLIAASKAAKRAERQNAATARFLSSLAHHLRQPMQAIQFIAPEVAKHVGPEGQALFQTLLDAHTRMFDMFETILDGSRLDAGLLHPQMQTFGINGLLQPLSVVMAAAAKRKGIAARYFPSDRAVISDKTLLSRMLDALIENAVRYTEQGEVCIECIEHKDTLTIQISDSGIGIADDHLELIWDDMYQVGNQELNRSNGLGMGLAKARRIADALGIDIRLESAIGKGSVFSVSLPLAEHGIDESDAEAAAVLNVSEPVPVEEPSDVRPRLLVLDDDVFLGQAFEVALSSNGHEVVVVSSYREADDAITITVPDAMIIDYRLPSMTGVEAYQRINAKLGRTIPAILLTGEISAEVKTQADNHNMRLLYKPCTTKQLLASVRGLISKAP